MEKDIEQRLEKIEDMLRHIHDHVENTGNEVWVVREGLPHVLQTIGDAITDLQKGEEPDRSGEEICNISRDLLLQLIESTGEFYSPIDEKDKEKHDKEEEEKERIRE